MEWEEYPFSMKFKYVLENQVIGASLYEKNASFGNGLGVVPKE